MILQKGALKRSSKFTAENVDFTFNNNSNVKGTLKQNLYLNDYGLSALARINF